MKRKPVLALTMGEPAGIGPEILAESLKDPRVRDACRPLVVGCRKALEIGGWQPNLAPLLDPGVECSFRPGHPTAESGLASFAAVKLAADFAMRGLVGGVVTAPISKEAWHLAGVPFLDHTDFLRHASGASQVAMMLLNGKLRAALATRHVPLAQVSGRLNAREVSTCAKLAFSELKSRLGIREPRLGLCALNPHAGEVGMLGPEERRILRPAVDALRRSGMRIDGPIAADAAWAAHQSGRWDALIALYHDQAMIPLKITGPYSVVNWTLGIPFVRTSPGHGTAFDIAGRGAANAEAMVQAILLAANLCQRRSAA